VPEPGNAALRNGILPGGRPLRVGLLSNPASGRNRHRLIHVIRIVSAYRDVVHRTAQTPGQINGVLEEFSRHNIDVLGINAGDGTVHAVLTCLFQRKPFRRIPLLALLRGGSTNMNIGDVGIPGRRDRALRRLLSWASSGHGNAQLVSRPVLRVQPSRGQSSLYGMFFGAGAIIKGIEYYHRNVKNKGIYDGTATGLVTLRVLLALARRDPGYIAPVPVSIEADPDRQRPTLPAQALDCIVLMATTLEKLYLGLHPHWGKESAAIHLTILRARPAHILRAMPPLFWGKANRFATAANGFISHKVDTLRLTMDSAFTLDGELYHADSTTGPVFLGYDGPVDFVRL
jgi:diacylglycerol kinase (ATP)